MGPRKALGLDLRVLLSTEATGGADLAASDNFTDEKAMEISKKFDTNFPVAH